MDIVLYQNIYEFHFWAGLNSHDLAAFLNKLPALGFKFREGKNNLLFDPERGPGVFSLHRKQFPEEERPIPRTQANYYIRWSARASEGEISTLARALAQQLRLELETQIWLVDGQAHAVRYVA